MRVIKSLICGIGLVAAFARGLSISETSVLRNYTFHQFVKDFNKGYTINSEEYVERKAVFDLKLSEVIEHNSGNETWFMAINKFSDSLPEDQAFMRGYEASITNFLRAKAPAAPIYKFASYDEEVTLPETVDWRKYMVPPKNQQDCGSCWAFSSTAAISAHLAISTGKMYDLSVEELISCMPNPHHCGGRGGCRGSTMEVAFKYVQENGIHGDAEYPYLDKVQKCKALELNSTYTVFVDGYHTIPANSYIPLMQALASVGPISVAVDASDWENYHGGIYNGCDKKHVEINHAVLLVGYGVENGIPYWLVRNSWGSDWGEDGHIRLRRHDRDVQCAKDYRPATQCDEDTATDVTVCGTCGILYAPSYPVGARVESA